MLRRHIRRPLRGGQVTIVTPKTILGASLVAWYRADKGVTGSPVTQWADQSGTGDANKNLTPDSVGPTFTAALAGLNSKPALVFDGVDSELHSGAWGTAPPSPGTIFIAALPTAGGGFFFDSISAARYFISMNGTAQYDIQQGTLASFPSAEVRAATILCVEFNGASSKVYQSALTALGTHDAGSSSPTGITIGATFVDSAQFTGSIAEVVVATGILSTALRTSMMNYMGTRYGVTIGA